MATTPRQRVIGILRSPTAKRIRFIAPAKYVGDVTIDHTAFETVAKAFEDLRIDIVVQPAAAFRRGIAAQYDTTNFTIPYISVAGFTSGTLKVQPITGIVGEDDVIHECVHAYFDLQSIKLGATDNEAIAYVVDALYARMKGLPLQSYGDVTTPGIDHSAIAVADLLLHQYQLGRVAVPRVDTRAFESLRIQVASDQSYADTPAGWASWPTGTDRYPEDG
jgi:hypothetical protein